MHIFKIAIFISLIALITACGGGGGGGSGGGGSSSRGAIGAMFTFLLVLSGLIRRRKLI